MSSNRCKCGAYEMKDGLCYPCLVAKRWRREQTCTKAMEGIENPAAIKDVIKRAEEVVRGVNIDNDIRTENLIIALGMTLDVLKKEVAV